MKKTTNYRLLGAFILLFNLWVIGNYNLQGIPVLLLTLGFAICYEYFVVRPVSKKQKSNHVTVKSFEDDESTENNESEDDSPWFKCKSCGFIAYGTDPDESRSSKCIGCGNIMGEYPKNDQSSRNENELLIDNVNYKSTPEIETNRGHLMNKKQKKLLITVASITGLMMLIPPFIKIHKKGGVVISRCYEIIFDAPSRYVIDISTLSVQLLGVLIVGSILFFVFKD